MIPPKRLVSGGNDKKVKIWLFIDSLKLPTVEEIGHHEECVRDVAWCNNIGLANKMIATCSDKICKVWKYENKWSET